MKKYFAPTIACSILCLAIINCSGNGYKGKPSVQVEGTFPDFNGKGDTRRNPPCDSIYSPKDPATTHFKDTVIKRTKYALAIPLSKKCTLAFLRYSEKWKRVSGMEILRKGVRTASLDDEKDQVYYDEIYPSPSGRYVFYRRYYVTSVPRGYGDGDVKEGNLKSWGGQILDIEKGQNIQYINNHQCNGNWTYCDNWVVRGKVIFNPERINENKK